MNITTIVFHIVLYSVVFSIGKFMLMLDAATILITLLIFTIVKVTIGKGKHYKSPLQCFYWSTAVLTLLMAVNLTNDTWTVILTNIFVAILLTGHGDIDDIAMFKRSNESKYKALDDFIKYNFADPRLLNYENYLKTHEPLRYNFYVLRFRQNETWEVIKNRTNIFDSKRINRELDMIYEALRYTLMLD